MVTPFLPIPPPLSSSSASAVSAFVVPPLSFSLQDKRGRSLFLLKEKSQIHRNALTSSRFEHEELLLRCLRGGASIDDVDSSLNETDDWNDDSNVDIASSVEEEDEDLLSSSNHQGVDAGDENGRNGDDIIEAFCDQLRKIRTEMEEEAIQEMRALREEILATQHMTKIDDYESVVGEEEAGEEEGEEEEEEEEEEEGEEDYGVRSAQDESYFVIGDTDESEEVVLEKLSGEGDDVSVFRDEFLRNNGGVQMDQMATEDIVEGDEYDCDSSFEDRGDMFEIIESQEPYDDYDEPREEDEYGNNVAIDNDELRSGTETSMDAKEEHESGGDSNHCEQSSNESLSVKDPNDASGQVDETMKSKKSNPKKKKKKKKKSKPEPFSDYQDEDLSLGQRSLKHIEKKKLDKALDNNDSLLLKIRSVSVQILLGLLLFLLSRIASSVISRMILRDTTNN